MPVQALLGRGLFSGTLPKPVTPSEVEGPAFSRRVHRSCRYSEITSIVPRNARVEFIQVFSRYPVLLMLSTDSMNLVVTQKLSSRRESHYLSDEA